MQHADSQKVANWSSTDCVNLTPIQAMACHSALLCLMQWGLGCGHSGTYSSSVLLHGGYKLHTKQALQCSNDLIKYRLCA